MVIEEELSAAAELKRVFAEGRREDSAQREEADHSEMLIHGASSFDFFGLPLDTSSVLLRLVLNY